MAAPRRILITFGKLEISAVPVPEVSAEDADKLVCKACAPKATKLKQLCSLVQHGFEFDHVYTIYLCRTCKRQWAVPYRLFHEVKETAV